MEQTSFAVGLLLLYMACALGSTFNLIEQRLSLRMAIICGAVSPVFVFGVLMHSCARLMPYAVPARTPLLVIISFAEYAPAVSIIGKQLVRDGEEVDGVDPWEWAETYAKRVRTRIRRIACLYGCFAPRAKTV